MKINLNFSKLQLIIISFGILFLIQSFSSGLGINFLTLSIGFLLLAVGLCYRNWWKSK